MESWRKVNIEVCDQNNSSQSQSYVNLVFICYRNKSSASAGMAARGVTTAARFSMSETYAVRETSSTTALRYRSN